MVLAAVLLVAAAGVWLLVRVHGILAPFALAGVLIYLIAPLVERLHRHGLGRPWAILVSYALVGLLAGGLLALALPDLIRELVRLSDLVPTYAAGIDAAVHNLRQGGAGHLPAPVQQAAVVAVGHLQGRAESAIRSATSGLLAIVSGLLGIVLAPFLAYYLLADLPRFHDRLVTAVPPGSRPALLAYVHDLDAMLSGFVRGQLLTAATIGGLVAAAMALLHVRYALTLGFVAGLGELVPYFGPFLASLPGLALAGAHSWRLLVEVAIAYAVIQQTESAIVHPYIVGHATGLHPLTVVFALLAGGDLAGLPGLIFAVPAAGVVQVTGIHLIRAAVAWRRVAADVPPRGGGPAATGASGAGAGAMTPLRPLVPPGRSAAHADGHRDGDGTAGRIAVRDPSSPGPAGGDGPGADTGGSGGTGERHPGDGRQP